MKRKIFIAAFVILGVLQARADEGMWMINAIDRALEAKMQQRGLALSASEIYNADAPGTTLADAVLSLDFACTGSIISDQGLVITNHHCAYSDIYSLSTEEHNYLEDGYWSFTFDKEIPIPGKSVQMLKRVIDVTDEVEALIDSLKAAGQVAGSRRVSSLMEKRYTSGDLVASLNSMWAGSKYYMALYQEYKDIRLVGAPPVSIAAFGGDIDNWEWPQHKADFAMYRIYAAPDGSPAAYSENNVPLRPAKKLSICTKGLSEGDYTMVIGYPGRTDRYCSWAKASFEHLMSLPAQNLIRGMEMEIVNSWMNADPQIRLKYSDYYFGLSNVQELREGQVQCVKRFGVLDQLRERDARLAQWINADSSRKEEFGWLPAALENTYEAVADVELNTVIFRETLIRATKLSLVSMRIASNSKNAWSGLPDIYASIDLRVEKAIFFAATAVFYGSVDREYWGGYQKELYERFGGDVVKLCEYVWDSSVFTDEANLPALTEGKIDVRDDAMHRFFSDVKVSAYQDKIKQICGDRTLAELAHEHTRALYNMRKEAGEVQYPDANSTMRITYGTVGGIEPWDGIRCDWKSTSAGILKKYNPDQYEYVLKPKWREKVGNYDGVVNFISDCDITGGNSGSPVLNAKGELVGLAFDGNKESLASDVAFTEDYNKCVCVDIRYVLYVLKEYAGMDRILSEIGITR